MSYDEHLISQAGGDGDPLDAIQRRADKASKGVWKAENLESSNGHRGIYWVSATSEGCTKTVAEVDANDGGVEAIWSFADAEFIANAPADIATLLALVRTQQATLAAVLNLANTSGRCGWRISADELRRTLRGES